MINDIKIIRSKRKTLSIELRNGEVIARAPARMNEKEIYAFVKEKESWINKHLAEFEEKQKILDTLEPYTPQELEEFRKRAKTEIPIRVKHYAEKIGVSYNRITIRNQRTRWGSCSSKGNLNFNCLLVLLPDEIIDSVVVHELCHIKHMNHSAQFYAEVEKVFPEYKKCHLWLNQNGRFYLR